MKYGIAVQVIKNGEIWDIGAGWASEEEARKELAEQGCDFFESVIFFQAVTEDGWETWEQED